MEDDVQPSPNKRKRNADVRERARVTRACDRCKRRKIKCTGIQPCEFCCRSGDRCTYETAYARGKAPVILPAAGQPQDAGASARSHEPTQNQQVSAGGSEQAREVSSIGLPPSLTPPTAAALTPGSHVSPQAGLHGHYIGPASGVSFLQRVQKRLGQATSFSAPDDIFTFGDAPFDQTGADLVSCMMLPKDVAQRFLDRYFDFAMPTYRFLHRPTIQSWFIEFYETFGAMHDTQRASARIGLVLMVLAHGRVYMSDAERPGPANLSDRLYQAAEQQLSEESGPIHLTSIQARLTQCYYLLTQSHINHCWRAFGNVSHLALATGLNRSRRAGIYMNLNNIEVQCRRRTFWCAYALDVHLSVVLGRPQLFHDDDIDVELPACIDDENLTKHQPDANVATSGLSIMLAPLAHIKLARIVKRILRELYPLTPIAASQRTVLTAMISSSLVEWRSDLDCFLDTDKFNASMFVPIVQRQRNVLNLTYWHAVILMYRPFLLKNFAGPTEDAFPSDEDLTENSVQQCVNSAMKTVNAINQMMQSRQMSRAFWIAAYFAFTASVVLYIYVIQKRAAPSEVYSEYLLAATQCQSHIASIADKGSLPERYLLLLEELRMEAIRQTDRNRNSATGAGVSAHYHVVQATSSLENDIYIAPSTYPDSDGNTVAEPAINFNQILSDDMTDYAEWDQFANLVSSGLGNLDAFLSGDSFGQTGEYAAAS